MNDRVAKSNEELAREEAKLSALASDFEARCQRQQGRIRATDIELRQRLLKIGLVEKFSLRTVTVGPLWRRYGKVAQRSLAESFLRASGSGSLTIFDDTGKPIARAQAFTFAALGNES